MLVIVALRPVIAQNSPQGDVKNNLVKLLDYSKSKAYDKAAFLIVYDGEDKTRVQKDSFNPANKDELNEVKRKCKKISASGTKDIYTLNVVFISGEQKLSTSFSFIKCEKGYLLSNMN
jgi:hypothetical protein